MQTQPEQQQPDGARQSSSGEEATSQRRSDSNKQQGAAFQDVEEGLAQVSDPLAAVQLQQDCKRLVSMLAPPPTEGQPANQKRRKSRIILNPSDSLCYGWSAVVSLAFLYNFWSLSFRFAFEEINASTWLIWMPLDYVADLVYMLDIWVNFRMGYLEDGVLQREPAKVARHYRDSTVFYLDMACLLPFDILYLSFGFNSAFRCNRIVKFYKFWSFIDRTERHTNYPNAFRSFTLVHNILVIFHWNACLFFMISEGKFIDLESLYRITGNHCDDTSCQYLHAFYWSTLALSNVGDLPRPRTKGQFLYVIIELLCGLFLFASVLGEVANIVTNVSADKKEFQARLDGVKTFMRTRRVSDELQNKVIRWFDYLWSSQKSSDEERSVACLPDRLKAEIAIHVNLDTLKRVDIFQDTEAGFLRELVLRLKPVLFSPGDYVCRKDEAGHEMYIVSRGILEVVTNEGRTVVATFRAGSYFGEIAVLNVGAAGNKRTASVRSVGYSDLFCLSKQDLWDVLKDYPNAEARIRAVAEERLSALGGRGAGGGDSTSDSKTRPLAGHSKGLLEAPLPQRRASKRLSRGHNSETAKAAAQQMEGYQMQTSHPGLPLPPTRRRLCSSASNYCRAAAILNEYQAPLGHPSHRWPAPRNSHTMEPICGFHDLARLPPQPRLHVQDCCPAAGYLEHWHRAGQQQDQQADLWSSRQRFGTAACATHSRHLDSVGQWAATGQCFSSSNQEPPGLRHHLSVQQPQQQHHHHHHQIGQSRSFECTPIAGSTKGAASCKATKQGPDYAPDRSRSSAPPDEAAAIQPQLQPNSSGASLTVDSNSTSDATQQASSAQQQHRQHMCLKQHQYRLQLLGAQLGRSSSMTTRPLDGEGFSGSLVGRDDDCDEDLELELATGSSSEQRNYSPMSFQESHGRQPPLDQSGQSQQQQRRRRRLHRPDCRHDQGLEQSARPSLAHSSADTPTSRRKEHGPRMAPNGDHDHNKVAQVPAKWAEGRQRPLHWGANSSPRPTAGHEKEQLRQLVVGDLEWAPSALKRSVSQTELTIGSQATASGGSATTAASELRIKMAPAELEEGSIKAQRRRS